MSEFVNFFTTYFWLIIFLIIWTIALKGLALWKAAKNSDFVWFVILLILNDIGILELIYIFAVQTKTNKQVFSSKCCGKTFRSDRTPTASNPRV